jgi:hypothetical protein
MQQHNIQYIRSMTLNKLSASQSWPTASNNRSSTCGPPTTSCVDRLLCNQRLLFQPLYQYLRYSPLQLRLNFVLSLLNVLNPSSPTKDSSTPSTARKRVALSSGDANTTPPTTGRRERAALHQPPQRVPLQPLHWNGLETTPTFLITPGLPPK